MKNILKYLAASTAIVCSVSALSACSNAIDSSKINGDWTATSVNGISIADYAASVGAAEADAAWNISVSDSGVTTTNVSGSSTMTLTKAADGSVITYIFEKGTFDFSAAAAAATTAAEAVVSTSEAVVSTADAEYYGSAEY